MKKEFFTYHSLTKKMGSILGLLALFCSLNLSAQTFNFTPGSLGSSAAGASTPCSTTSGTYNFPVNVTGSAGSVSNVALNYTHSWTTDLRFELVSPSGAVTLLIANGGTTINGTEGGTLYSPGDPCVTTQGVYTHNGTAHSGNYTAASALPAAADGVWTLRITDGVGGDCGWLNSASITFISNATISTNLTAAAVTTVHGGSLVRVVDMPSLVQTTRTETDSIVLTAGATGCIVNLGAYITYTGTNFRVNGVATTTAGLVNLALGLNTITLEACPGTTVTYRIFVKTALIDIGCTPNKVVALGPGECTATAAWPCPTFSASGTGAVTNVVAHTGTMGSWLFSCGAGPVRQGRVLRAPAAPVGDPCAAQTFTLSNVTFRPFNTGTYTIRVFTVNPAAIAANPTCPAIDGAGALTLLSTFTYNNTVFFGNAVAPAPAGITINAGAYYYIDVAGPGGGAANSVVWGDTGINTETSCSYMSSAACVLTSGAFPNPITVTAGGFGFLVAGVGMGVVPPVAPVQTAGPAQGTQLVPGVYNICYSITDGAGQSASCCFTYEVRAYSGPVSPSLSCNDLLNVSLDTSCSAVLGADMFLEGGPYKCYDNYKVQMSSVSMNGPWRDNVGCGKTANFYNDNKIHLCANDLGKTYFYQVIDLNNPSNKCWGQFKVEDKVAPKIVCPPNQTIACDVPLEPAAVAGEICSASVNANGATSTSTVLIPLTLNSSNLYYNALISKANFTIKVRGGSWIGDLRSRLIAPNGAIYRLNWTQNIGPGALGCADDNGDLTFDNASPIAPNAVTCGGNFITATIRPEDQILLPSGVDICGYRGAGSSFYGTWTLEVYDDFPGDAIGNIQLCLNAQPAGTLLPNGLRLGTAAEYGDPEYWSGANIFNKVTGFDNGVNATQVGLRKYKVKAGLLDNCTEAILTYVDVINDVPCTATTSIIRTVTRTWTAVDATGNSARCTQTISVTKADIAKLTMPQNWDGQLGQQRVLNICSDFWPDNYDLCGTNPLGYGHGTTKWVRKANGYPAAKVSEVLNDGQDIGGGCGVVKINGNDAYVIGEFDPFHDPLYPGTDTLCLRGTGMPSGATCSTINMLYNDTPLPTCGDGYKLLRDWRILDWCNGQIRNHTQVIKVQDMNAPVVTCPDNLTVSTDGLDCTASGAFPVPKVSDVCSSTSYDVYFDAVGSDPLPSNAGITKLADGSYRYTGFTCGDYNFRYVVQDVCGNRTECTGFKMSVRDVTVPVAVCRSLTEVTLTNTVDDPTTTNFKECGLTRVEARFFDEGSWDNCGPVYFKVKRNDNRANLYDFDGRFDDYVYFNCDDVGAEKEVILRVYDQQPVAGHVSDAYRPTAPVVTPVSLKSCGSNFNDCIVKVNVKDLVNPTLTCPDNINIECSTYDFSIPLTNADTAWFNKYFGKIVTTDCNGVNAASKFTYIGAFGTVTANNGRAFDNCTVNIRQEFRQKMSCGVGTIEREFQAVDKGGRTSPKCIQFIYINNSNPFDINPNQYTDPGNDLADPCDGVERNINYKVDYIKDPIDVLNNLVDPAVTPSNQDGIIWPDQYVELETCQGKGDSIGTSCEKGKGAGYPKFVRNDKCDQLGITYTDEYFPITLPACKKIIRTWTVIDWCQDKPEGRRWTYQQYIKFTNKVAPNFTGNSCKNDTICQYPVDCGPDPVTLSASAEDDCTPAGSLKYRATIDLNNNGTVDLAGNGSSITISKNNGLKYGTHMITWSVEDGCGNVKTCTKTFLVKDCKRPTPVAKLLSVELMPSLCMAVLEASKVNNFSWDNCTPMSELRFRLAKAGTYSANMTLAEVLALDDKVTFTGAECGTQSVALFVIDNDGNFDYTETVIIVQSNLDPTCCGGKPTANVSGTIKTETGEDVQDVKIMINGTSLSVTPASGLFNVLLAAGGNITVAPEKDINPMNGVSTADLVAINKHILGISSLNSPYKQIAADVNKDKRISTADMVELRKMILYIQTNFNNNKSWRFVDKSYNFTTNNPLTENFNESINFANLQGNQSVNFVAAKIGDVNGSASPNQLVSGEERGNGTLVFDAENATLAAGETKTIEFKAADIANIGGYQFTMNFDKEAIEVMEMAGTDMTANNFGMLLNEGAITTSFDGKVSSDVVFTMTVKAKKNVQLSDVISVGSRFTVAEAYTLNGDKMDVALSFNGKVAGTFELFQNQPNPFNGKTVVGFTMPQAGNATITVFDAAGRTVKVVEMNAVKGYNQVILDKSELSAGVLSYRLTTAGFSATKQMIVTE